MRLTGRCYAWLAWDLGASIDLDRAESRIRKARARRSFRHPRRAPTAVGEQSAPLVVTLDGAAIDAGSVRTDPTADVSLYDFGGACVSYSIPVDGPSEALVPLSEKLQGNDVLRADSLRRLEELLAVLGDAVDRPGVSAIHEDYTVFSIDPEGLDLVGLFSEEAAILARILRGETGSLSDGQLADAIGARLSYGHDDVAAVDWATAFLVGEDTSDERAVLEVANVALLQLRLLDGTLDRAVDSAWKEMSRRRRWAGGLGLRSESLRRVARMQIESAVLYEDVHNSMKLTGDQYLARVYRLAAERFHLPAWAAGIERKLEVLDGIHEKLSGLATTRRLEVLEWIIIVLIMFSIMIEVLNYLLPA